METKDKILIVEDEEKIARFVTLELEHEGYQVEHAADGRTAVDLALERDYDLILLDVLLPQLNGMEVLRRVRKHKDVPVIMVTARDAVMDKVAGLDAGADDYLTKPFSLMELASRCRALLRRGGMVKQASDVLSVGDIVLSPSHREVTVAGEPLKLTLREFDLLEYLMRKPGVVFTRESLLQSVWGWDFDGGSRTVDVHIKRLREKVEGVSDQWALKTVWGVGYKFEVRQ